MTAVADVLQRLRERPALQWLRASALGSSAGADSSTMYDQRWQRCVQRLCERFTVEDLLARIDELLNAAPSPKWLLPTTCEVTEHILPFAQCMRERLPEVSTELNLSTPAASPDRPCLGLVIRLHPLGRPCQVKIRIAAFVHPVQGLHWEVGYVDVSRSLQRFRTNHLGPALQTNSPSMLRAMVDATVRIASQRPCVQGLDLTPAHFHVLRLCLAVGGRPPTGFDVRLFEQGILAATRHTLAARGNWPHQLDTAELSQVKPRYLAAWLFERGLMLEPQTGLPMTWHPPRLVRPLDRA